MRRCGNVRLNECVDRQPEKQTEFELPMTREPQETHEWVSYVSVTPFQPVFVYVKPEGGMCPLQ